MHISAGFGQPPCSEAVAEGNASSAQWSIGAGTVCYTLWYTSLNNYIIPKATFFCVRFIYANYVSQALVAQICTT